MAPNKKKKKPAANATRGFATTSVTSKSKIQEIETEKAAEAIALAVENVKLAPSSDNAPVVLPQNADSDFTNLTPEELEAKLEESELQLLVEKHADKIKKDALRQITRLQTEKRLLRSQAERLSLVNWLPDELIDLILGHPTVNQQDTFTLSEMAKPHLSIDELSNSIWCLSKTLNGLGLPKECTQATIHRLIRQEVSGLLAMSESNKDTLWGLDEALDWLAGNASHEDLPDYETGNVKSQRAPDYATDIRFDEPESRLFSLLFRSSRTFSTNTKHHLAQSALFSCPIDLDDTFPAMKPIVRAFAKLANTLSRVWLLNFL